MLKNFKYFSYILLLFAVMFLLVGCQPNPQSEYRSSTTYPELNSTPIKLNPNFVNSIPQDIINNVYNSLGEISVLTNTVTMHADNPNFVCRSIGYPINIESSKTASYVLCLNQNNEVYLQYIDYPLQVCPCNLIFTMTEGFIADETQPFNVPVNTSLIRSTLQSYVQNP